MNWLKGTAAAVGLMVSCVAVADSAAQVELMDNLHQRMLDALQASSVDQVTEVLAIWTDTALVSAVAPAKPALRPMRHWDGCCPIWWYRLIWKIHCLS